MIAAVVLAGAFWVFTLAEQLDHPARYALAVGGLAFTAMALVAGWIAETAVLTLACSSAGSGA